MAEAAVTFRSGSILKRAQFVTTDTMNTVFTSWTRIYSAFIRRRFVKASRKDGTWPSLRPSTIRRRRKQSDVILRDTNQLFSQLSPEFVDTGRSQISGQKFVAPVTFGGKGQYPDGLTVTDVMRFHQAGGGHLPQRKILVDADDATKKIMAEAGKRIIIESLKA